MKQGKKVRYVQLVIEGAAVFAEFVQTDNGYRSPGMNPEYRFMTLFSDCKNMVFVSKDGRDFVPAIAVQMEGKPFTAPELYRAAFEDN